ncbi:hypothetical protein [Cupriavidus sp. DL-D2]|uniref:hypothetical protein n=1 Tax=Cupriavidus sp. DL-D2 TaxID=3144974 RepID=UPI0032134155
MKWEQFERIFSEPRVSRYRARCHGDEGFAMVAYRQNVLLSEALTPFLGTVEVALRNAVHQQLSRHYGRRDWWNAWRGDNRFARLTSDVADVRVRLQRRRETPHPDKIVAELTFGFWTTLFNAEYQEELWSALRFVFPHCPKEKRKRSIISSVLNRLRYLRNRTFHHEPILWEKGNAIALHGDGLEMLMWIHGDLYPWLARINRVSMVWDEWETLRASMQQTATRDGRHAKVASGRKNVGAQKNVGPHKAGQST